MSGQAWAAVMLPMPFLYITHHANFCELFTHCKLLRTEKFGWYTFLLYLCTQKYLINIPKR